MCLIMFYLVPRLLFVDIHYNLKLRDGVNLTRKEGTSFELICPLKLEVHIVLIILIGSIFFF